MITQVNGIADHTEIKVDFFFLLQSRKEAQLASNQLRLSSRAHKSLGAYHFIPSSGSPFYQSR